MEDLSEEALLKHLNAKRDAITVSHEEVKNPDYNVWGRAREWSYEQSVCLMAGMAPLTKPYFNILTQEDSIHLLSWIRYYPTEPKDRTRMQNIDKLLLKIPLAAQAKKNGTEIKPQELLKILKYHSILGPLLPAALLEVVEKLGPHPSLDLPNQFSALEIDPSALESLKKFKERKNMPIAYHSFGKAEPPAPPPTLPIPTESPRSIAKRLFPLKKTGRWEKTDALSLNEIVLLYYEIDPESIYETRFLGEPLDFINKEFLDYLNRYFLGERQLFVNQLDEDKLADLLRRSVSAGSIKPSEQNTFLKTEIIAWMASKRLEFPLSVAPDNCLSKKEISKEDILNYDLKRLDKDQLAKLITRCTAGILWKDSRSRTSQDPREHPCFEKALVLVQEIIGKKDPFDEKTVEDWIRNLNPNYKPKK
jgi:hypothetical protein